MAYSDDFRKQLFRGLETLAASAFPKHCANCGRVFMTAEAFLQETNAISEQHSGLKEGDDDDGRRIVEAFRNCPCGSTLMSLFNDRRDASPAGLLRRQRFGEMLDFLIAHGIDRDTARAELIKVVRGEHSDLLACMAPPGSG